MVQQEVEVSVPSTYGLPAFKVSVHFLQLHPTIELELVDGKLSLLELTRNPFPDERPIAKTSVDADANVDGGDDYIKFVEVWGTLFEWSPWVPLWHSRVRRGDRRAAGQGARSGPF